MKLFQRLLVAPAALGLLAPISAYANEVNLNEISNYSDVESIEFANFNNEISTKSILLAGGEGLTDDHDHGPEDSFSSTTSASFSVDMAIGAVSGKGVTTTDTDGDETVQAAYGYQIDLSTSFTGEDSLNVAIKSGDAGSALGELDLNDFSDKLTVDGITYTFPVGDKLTLLVGDSTDGSALYSTACVYGGFTNTLDDCGNASSAFESPDDSVALSASYDIGSGFTGAFGYAGQGTSEGLMTKDGSDYYGAQISYAADNYGASVTYANTEKTANSSTEDQTLLGLNAYYVPDSSLPTISVGYEMGDPETDKDTRQWFVGLQWDEMGPGTLGVAAGSKGATRETDNELLAYEAFYSYPVNDGMTITPAVFIMENATGSEDETGVVVKTSFSF
jgi:hypothetical protein